MSFNAPASRGSDKALRVGFLCHITVQPMLILQALPLLRSSLRRDVLSGKYGIAAIQTQVVGSVACCSGSSPLPRAFNPRFKAGHIWPSEIWPFGNRSPSSSTGIPATSGCPGSAVSGPAVTGLTRLASRAWQYLRDRDSMRLSAPLFYCQRGNESELGGGAAHLRIAEGRTVYTVLEATVGLWRYHHAAIRVPALIQCPAHAIHFCVGCYSFCSVGLLLH